MSKAKRTGTGALPATPETDAPRLVFNAVLLPDEALDETPEGYGVYLCPGGDFPAREVSATFTVTAKIKPLALVRAGGKWFVQFDIVPPGPELNYAVECGDAPAPFTFGESARVLFGA